MHRPTNNIYLSFFKSIKSANSYNIRSIDNTKEF